MTLKHTIFVFFDEITPEEFDRRLGWEFLVRAWSGSINWHQVSPRGVVLELNGIDGLNRIHVTRRRIGARIYIAAHKESGDILQTGVWWYDEAAQSACCARRIYDEDLVETLNTRLPDFCFNTFVKEAA